MIHFVSSFVSLRAFRVPAGRVPPGQIRGSNPPSRRIYIDCADFGR